MGVMKENLVALGITEENAEKFIAENITNKMIPYNDFQKKVDEVDKLTADIKELTESVEPLKVQIADRDRQLEGLIANATSVEDYQKQIEELQKSNKESQEKYDTEMLQLKKQYQLEQSLSREGAINIELMKPVFADFINNVELDKDGKIVGLDEEVQRIKADEKFSFGFNKEAELNNPLLKAGFTPGGGTNPITGDVPLDPSKMTYEQFAASYEHEINPNVG